MNLFHTFAAHRILINFKNSVKFVFFYKNDRAYYSMFMHTFLHICAYFSALLAKKRAYTGLSELADQNNTVNSSSSGNNRKNVQKNLSSIVIRKEAI
jgi:hypothetical protein